jgi:hypothetical protein
MWLAGQIVVGAAIWGGIRQDIKGMHQRQDEQQASILYERRRIDALWSGRSHLDREGEP